MPEHDAPTHALSPIPPSSLTTPTYTLYQTYSAHFVVHDPAISYREPPNPHLEFSDLFRALRALYEDPPYVAGRSVRYLPERIFRAVEEHVGFYVVRVEPALRRLHEEGSEVGRGERWQLGADVMLDFVSRVTDLVGCTMGGLTGEWEIQKRCFAGLLREGLVELVVRVLEEVRGRMEVFVRCADEAVGLGAVRWKGMKCGVESMLLRGMMLQTMYWKGMLEGLLLNPRFRSERLEILLLKYLREDAGERGERVGRKVREVTMNKMIGKLRKPKKWSTYHEATGDRDSEWEDVFLEAGWTQVPKPFLHGHKMLEWWKERLQEQASTRENLHGRQSTG